MAFALSLVTRTTGRAIIGGLPVVPTSGLFCESASATSAAFSASGLMSFRTSIVCLPSQTELMFEASASEPAMKIFFAPRFPA